MTKKHFEAIAAIIALSRAKDCEREVPEIKMLAHRLATYFSSQNPRFDCHKFMTACGF